MPELQPLRADHAAAVLAFELENRAYFAASISDRGDDFYDQYADRHTALLAEQESGSCACYVLVDADGSVLGRFNLYELHDGTADLGYRVAQRVAGRGVATATVAELCRLAAAEHGLHMIRAATTHENIASARVLIKAGFLPVGPAVLAGRPGTSYQRDLAARSVPDLKTELHGKLQACRAGLLSRIGDLSEFDRRRPMTPTGTNLLGLVKHLAGLEYAYLGDSLGHPAPERMSWFEDGSIWQGADMWATPEESSDYIVGLYQRACAHADAVIAALDLEAPASVAHWPKDRRNTTLAVLLIRMVAETAQHAGHADIVRELIDGKGGPDHDDIDERTWREYLAQVQAAASAFAPDPAASPGTGR